MESEENLTRDYLDNEKSWKLRDYLEELSGEGLYVKEIVDMPIDSRGKLGNRLTLGTAVYENRMYGGVRGDN